MCSAAAFQKIFPKISKAEKGDFLDKKFMTLSLKNDKIEKKPNFDENFNMKMKIDQ